MIPAAWTDLPLPNYRALRAFARPDSAFWKERQKEFLEHNKGENVLLGAWWLSGDGCTFYAGGDMKSPSEEVWLVFKALAREAGKGLGSARGSEAWIDWLELLSCAEDESTGGLRYKVSLGSSYVHDSRSESAILDAEEIPKNALIEYRLMSNGRLRKG